jgi:O-antigen/teichoic acid export membrane protein
MIGRGSTGAIPLGLTAIASRHSSLAAGGTVASLVAVAYLAAELSDFQAQRDIARSKDEEDVGRSLAYRASVFGIVLPIAAAAACAVAPVAIVVAFVSAGLWTVLINTYAGRALQRGDFESLAVGPVTGFASTLLLALILPRFIPGLFAYAVALHVGRLAEFVTMIVRTGVIHPARFSWRSEWKRTKDLLFSSAASTIVGRSLTPAAFVLVGPVAAGVFGISTQLMGAFALLPLSIATTAFHQARGAASPADAMNRMREPLRLALVASGAFLVPAVIVAIWAGHRFLGYNELWMYGMLAITLASAFLEPWVSFSTAALQIAYRDRDLFFANGIGAVVMAILTPLCAWIFGPIGLGIGVAIARVISVVFIWIPKTRQ